MLMILSLQSLRFVCCMMVVVTHILDIYGKDYDSFGACGLEFFFMLSGFVLSYAYGKSVEDGTFRTFALLKKQLLKFYPLHLVTFLLVVLLDARLGVYYEWYRLLPSMFLLQCWIPSDSFTLVANGVAWFLCDMVFFYCVFSMMFRLLMHLSWRRLVLLVTVVAAVYFAVALFIPMSLVDPLIFAFPLTRLLDFCIGILLFRVYSSSVGRKLSDFWQRQTTAILTAVELLLIAGVVISLIVYPYVAVRLRCVSLFWLVLPQVLLFFAQTDKSPGKVASVLHHPLQLWLSSFSFEVFLTHLIVLRLIWSVMLALGYGMEYRVMAPVMIVSCLICIAVGWMVKHCFTEPVTKRLKPYIIK